MHVFKIINCLAPSEVGGKGLRGDPAQDFGNQCQVCTLEFAMQIKGDAELGFLLIHFSPGFLGVALLKGGVGGGLDRI